MIEMIDKNNYAGVTSLDSTGIFQRYQRIGILSLGCPRNLVDSEGILARLNLKGYSIVDMDSAEVAIVNTCAFIEDAQTESIDAILDLIDLKKEGRLKKIIVYGCLTQRYKDELIRLLPKGVDAFVGRIELTDYSERFSLTPRHYAYLKICEGCINSCSYCIIPKIKPRFTSLDIDSILKSVEKFDRDGLSELNIIGQDITGFGMDLYKTSKLIWLLEKILRGARNIHWIRLLYLNPNRLSDELLELMYKEEKICKYVDLPIQHINDRILKLMQRQTTKKDILSLIQKIRKKMPGVAIRTSLIVGFPSETENEFRELLDFIEEIRFERLGVFIYSREEGTPAFNLEKQIPKEVKIEYFNTIMSYQQRISQENTKKFLGETIDVLIDEEASSTLDRGRDQHRTSRKMNVYLGRSQYDAPEVDGLVYVNSKRQLTAGDFVKVRVTDTLEYDLVGDLL